MEPGGGEGESGHGGRQDLLGSIEYRPTPQDVGAVLQAEHEGDGRVPILQRLDQAAEHDLLVDAERPLQQRRGEHRARR